MGPSLGAIAGCHCSVGGEGDDQLWGSGRDAIGGVDVVPLQGAIVWFGGRVTTNFEGVDVVPLQGAIAVCFG